MARQLLLVETTGSETLDFMKQLVADYYIDSSLAPLLLKQTASVRQPKLCLDCLFFFGYRKTNYSFVRHQSRRLYQQNLECKFQEL